MFFLDKESVSSDSGSHKSHHRATTANRYRQVSSGASLTGRKKSSALLTTSLRHKQQQKKEYLNNAISDLLHYFNNRNLNAIIKVIRITLEKLRKRISISSIYGKIEYSIDFFLSLFDKSR